MSLVRVFVPTYRRPLLLPRALQSLREQSFIDWRCEVHNDAPDDKFPDQLVARINDPRITVVNHIRRLGGAATMNAFYAPAEEPFVSILEDDNWWESEFLEKMVLASCEYPASTIFWANMRVWKEEENGSFTYTGRTIYPEDGPSHYEQFWWPDNRQIMGAVHSNGACLIRSRPDGDYRIPAVPFATIEMFRERIFAQPLILVRRPLANFSITITTERAADGLAYGEATAVLAATFLREACWSDKQLRDVFEASRRTTPPSTNTLLNAAILEPKARLFFRMASAQDIFRWLAGLARRPAFFRRILHSRKRHPDWWAFLENHTGKRFTEARKRSADT
jgi:hypothetical protein